jgi:uncharacterized membrane protein YqhA
MKKMVTVSGLKSFYYGAFGMIAFCSYQTFVDKQRRQMDYQIKLNLLKEQKVSNLKK